MVSAVCFCVGLVLLTFGGNRVLLAVAVAVFICGEILMTPCFAETAKTHSQAGTGKSGMYQGVLHVFEGGGRVLGSMTALAAYGYMRGTVLVGFYWVIMATAFLLFSATLHWWSYRAARSLGAGQAAQPAVAVAACDAFDEIDP
jgi:hypothetical protein